MPKGPHTPSDLPVVKNSDWKTNRQFITVQPNFVDYGPANTLEEILVTKNSDHMFCSPSLWYKDGINPITACPPACPTGASGVPSSACANKIYQIGMNFTMTGVPSAIPHSTPDDPIYLNPHTGVLSVSSHVNDLCDATDNSYSFKEGVRSFTVVVTPTLLPVSGAPPAYPNVSSNTPLPSVSINISFVWVNAWCTNFTALLGHNFLVPDIAPAQRCSYFVYPLVSDVLTRDPAVEKRLSAAENNKDNVELWMTDPETAKDEQLPYPSESDFREYSYYAASGLGDGYGLQFSVTPPTGGAWTNNVYAVGKDTPITISDIGTGVVVVEAPPPTLATPLSDTKDDHMKNPVSQKEAYTMISNFGMSDNGKTSLSFTYREGNFPSSTDITNGGFQEGKIKISSVTGGNNSGYTFDDLSLKIRWMLPDDYRSMSSFLSQVKINGINSVKKPPPSNANVARIVDDSFYLPPPTEMEDVWDISPNPVSAKSSSINQSESCQHAFPPLEIPPKNSQSQAAALGNAMSAIGVTTCSTQSAGFVAASLFPPFGAGGQESSSTGCDSALGISESYNTFQQNISCQINSVSQSSKAIMAVDQSIYVKVGGDFIVQQGAEVDFVQKQTGKILNKSNLENADQQHISNSASNAVKSITDNTQHDSAGWGAQQQGSKTIKTMTQNMNSVVDAQSMNSVTQNVFSALYVSQNIHLEISKNLLVMQGGKLKFDQESNNTMMVYTITKNIFTQSVRDVNVSSATSTTTQTLVNQNKGMPNPLSALNAGAMVMIAGMVLVVMAIPMILKILPKPPGLGGAAGGQSNTGQILMVAAGGVLLLGGLGDGIYYLIEHKKKPKTAKIVAAVVGAIVLVISIILLVLGIKNMSKSKSMGGLPGGLPGGIPPSAAAEAEGVAPLAAEAESLAPLAMLA